MENANKNGVYVPSDWSKYWEGNKACRGGLPSDFNPYPVGSSARVDWKQGFRSAWDCEFASKERLEK